MKITEGGDMPSEEMLKTSHIICEGFFQKSEYYVPYRDKLLDYLSANLDDMWINHNGDSEYFHYFMTPSSQELTPNDIVVSLRLDDFIQLPNPKSDVLPPRFYTEILEKWFSTANRTDGRLFIVCDKLRSHWEYKYLDFFGKWSPILIQGTLCDDFALMRDCPALIHSNSTLCWMASFLSAKKKTRRFIPITGTYASQRLEHIDELTDDVIRVITMEHDEVYRLNIMCDHRDFVSLPYSIPDELIVDSAPVHKKYVVSPLIPGDSADYAFSAGQESQYYDSYKSARFAITQKKGGWDCLRHYEIMANGAIPIFEELEKCPEATLASFPKRQLAEAKDELLPWYGTDVQKELYEKHRARLLVHVRNHCSTSATAGAFLRNMSHLGSAPKILMLTGHKGVNYTRELTWIGVKRQVEIAVEWPTIPYLYDSFPEERLPELYGNGFTYSRRLPESTNVRLTEEEVVKSIVEKRWDMIIYGKVGPDEGTEGSIPNLPLWEHVFKRYSRDEIAFWYGGDAIQDMTWENRHSTHLARHCQYARCFIRELNRWNGVF